MGDLLGSFPRRARVRAKCAGKTCVRAGVLQLSSKLTLLYLMLDIDVCVFVFLFLFDC